MNSAKEIKRDIQQGLTLIEVLVAFAILSAIVVSVFALISQNARFMIVAEERLLASIVADNLIVSELAGTNQRRRDPQGEVELGGRIFVFDRSELEITDEAEQITYLVRLRESEQTLARMEVLRER